MSSFTINGGFYIYYLSKNRHFSSNYIFTYINW